MQAISEECFTLNYNKKMEITLDTLINLLGLLLGGGCGAFFTWRWQQRKAAAEAKEKEATGIKNLKIRYNKVFGYYIEVSKGQCNLVKDEYG